MTVNPNSWTGNLGVTRKAQLGYLARYLNDIEDDHVSVASILRDASDKIIEENKEIILKQMDEEKTAKNP